MKLVGQIAALACVAGLLALLVWKLTHQQHAPPVGSQAPAFTLSRLDGPGSVSLASLRGRPIVLNFWASWCGPCKDEAPVLAELAHRYGSKLDIVGVNSQDDIGDARSFAHRYGLDFTVVHDTGSVYRKWGLGGLPETFVIAPGGKVVKHFPGQITGSDLEQALQPYAEGS